MNLELLCKNVIVLTTEVAQFIRSEKIRTTDIEIKSKNSLVTYVDKTAEKRLVEGLTYILPESGFITEEGTSSKQGNEYRWIIDPLDGTTNFIHGLAVYCISIALQKNEKTVLGVIYEVNTKECFYSWEGGKAYMNEEQISVSSATKLEDTLLATGFPYYDYSQLDDYMNLLKELMRESRGIRRLGSAAMDLAFVACGRMDGFFEYSLNAWDVAAGAFIVQQAGGKVCDFQGGEDYLFGKEIVASNSAIFIEFLGKIRSHMNK